MNPVLERLLSLGLSKADITRGVYGDNLPYKKIKQHSNNVMAWTRDWYQPNDDHQKKLQEMLVKAEQAFEKHEPIAKDFV